MELIRHQKIWKFPALLVSRAENIIWLRNLPWKIWKNQFKIIEFSPLILTFLAKCYTFQQGLTISGSEYRKEYDLSYKQCGKACHDDLSCMAFEWNEEKECVFKARSLNGSIVKKENVHFGLCLDRGESTCRKIDFLEKKSISRPFFPISSTKDNFRRRGKHAWHLLRPRTWRSWIRCFNKNPQRWMPAVLYGECKWWLGLEQAFLLVEAQRTKISRIDRRKMYLHK